MSLTKQQSLDAMRTFARDVAREQGETAQPVGDSEVSKDSSVPHVAKPAKGPKQEKKPAKKASPVPPPKPPKIPKPPAPKPAAIPKPPAPKKDSEPKPPPKPKEEQKSKTKAKQIPPFHELQKAVKEDIKAETKATTPKPEPTKKKKGITASKPAGGGTIITDNKKSRPAFFTELKRSITNWFANLKKATKPKKDNTYSVTKTERRKGVVQKATSKTGTIFTADRETLQKQIKARQRAEKNEHDDLSWSPYTEPGYALLEGEETESTDPRVQKVAVVPKTQNVPKPVIKSTEKIPELQKKTEQEKIEREADAIEATKAPVKAKAAAPAEAPMEPAPEASPVAVPAPEPVPDPLEEVDDFDTVTEESSNEETPEVREEDAWNLDDISLKDTNTLALVLVGMVLGLGFIGFMLYSIFSGSDESTNLDTRAPIVSLYQDANLNTITLETLTFNELTTAFNASVLSTQAGGTHEYVFLNAKQDAVPPSVLIDILRTQADDGFRNIITAVRLIRTDDGERALLLTSTDRVGALGGMLDWEDSLLADVLPILDITDVPPNAGSFVDQQVDSLDARVLIFDDRVLLLYALVNETDVLIATDSSLLDTYLNN